MASQLRIKAYAPPAPLAIKSYTPVTKAPTDDEQAFRAWYGTYRGDLSPDPDSPDQFYDYRAAFLAGAMPDAAGHWPSQYKKPGHPTEFVEGFSTRTGARQPGVAPGTRRALEAGGWSPEFADTVSLQAAHPAGGTAPIQPVAAHLTPAERVAIPQPSIRMRPPPDAVPPARDVGANLRTAAASGVARLSRAVNAPFWRAIGAAGEALHLPSVADLATRTVTTLTEQVTAQELTDPLAGEIERGVYSGVESIAMTAPAIALGILSGNPAPLLAAMGFTTGSDTFETAMASGKPPLEAAKAAVADGATEVLTELLPASKLLKDLAANKALWKTVLAQVGLEVPQEQVATLVQDLNEWVYLNPDKPFSAYRDERWSAAKQTLVATIVGTVAQTAGATAVQRVMQTLGTGQETPLRQPEPRPRVARQTAPPPAPVATAAPVDVQPLGATLGALVELWGGDQGGTWSLPPAAPHTAPPVAPVAVQTPPEAPSVAPQAPSASLNAPPELQVATFTPQQPAELVDGQEVLSDVPDLEGRTLMTGERVRTLLGVEPREALERGWVAVEEVEGFRGYRLVQNRPSEEQLSFPPAGTRDAPELQVATFTPPEPAERKFASTQVDLPPGVAHDVLAMAATVKDEDLAADGRETQPHLTVKYGLHTDDVEEVRAVLKDVAPIRATFGTTSHFAGVEGGTADAVKIDIVASPELHALNAKIAEALETTDTYPEYRPHVTLAYVQPGKGKEYDGLDALEGQTILLENVTFSAKDGGTVRIPLTGAQRAPAVTSPRQPTPAVTKPVSEMTDEELWNVVVQDVEGQTPPEEAHGRPATTPVAGPAVSAEAPRAAAAEAREGQPSVTYNDRLESVEVRFAEKPSEEVRKQLKRAGYRWAKTSGTWYRRDRAKQKTEAVAEAEILIGARQAPEGDMPGVREVAISPDLRVRREMEDRSVEEIRTIANGQDVRATTRERRIAADVLRDRGEEPKAPEKKPVTPQIVPAGVAVERPFEARPPKTAAEEQREALATRKAENAKKRDDLITQLAKDLSTEIGAGVNPKHGIAMIGIVRTYLDDGVVEARKAALLLQAQWQDLTGETFPEKLRAYFAAAWKRLTGQTVDVDTVFGKAQPESEIPDEDGTVAGGEAVAAEPDRPGGRPPDAGERPPRAAAGPGGPAVVSGEGAGEGGPVSAGPRPVRGGRPVRPAAVAAENPALGADRYRITDSDSIGTGSARERVTRNLAAIRIVTALAREQRRATPEEQAALVRYVGWGGLPRIFEYWKREEGDDSPDAFWNDADRQLKELLTTEEYSLARNSTQNAHYTSPTVIRAMWDAVRHLGVRTGSFLEPAAGIGHFVGLVPEDLRSAPWALVEKDGVTAAIASALYPGTYAHHSGFQAATLPDNHFAVAISNVPFGAIPITDPTFQGPAFVKQRIHNYFFAKALDKVAPGGLIAFVTSHGTMDARDDTGQRVREYLASRADFLGGIRLPFTAFKATAGTEVVTDILFLRKRHAGAQAEHAGPWAAIRPVTLANKEGAGVEQHVNEYFLAHPEMVLGTHTSTGKMRRADTYNVEPTGDLAAQLADTVRRLPANAIDLTPPAATLAAFTHAQAPAGTRPFEFLIHDDRLAQVIDGRATPLDLSKADDARIRALLPIRTALLTVYDRMAEDASDAKVTAAQKALTQAYDRFVKKHGPISKAENWDAFREDPDLPLLLSLEEYDEERETATKTAIFTTRTTRAARRATTASSPQAALLIALGETARIDLARVGELLGQGPEQAAATLQADGLIIDTPSGWQLPVVYLSGNVRVKLAEASAAAALDSRYQAAVDRLMAVIPEDLPAYKINVRLGAAWVPPSYVQEFVEHIARGASGVTVSYQPTDAKWSIDGTGLRSKFDTADVGTKDLLLDALNDRRRTIKRTVEGTTVVDRTATALARQRKEDLHKAFTSWLLKDEGARRSWAVRTYNDAFNAYVEPTIDGAFLTFPGMADFWREQIADHQRDAVARILLMGDTLLAHVVGAGKTLTMVAAAMEMKRLGIARKPLFVVPNHLISQVPSEFLQHYPNARVLVATSEDLSKDRRRRFTARIASGQWDAVIMPYSAFVRVSMSAEAERAYHREILDEIETAILAEYRRDLGEHKKGRRGTGKTPPSVKRLENMRDRVQKKLDALAKRPKDDMLDFEQLGVDALFVDEAHSFKNLYFATRQQAAGIPSDNDAQRAADLYLKVRYLNRQSNYRTVVLATGTPVSNSMAEIFVMQKLLQEHALERAGIHTFDAWLAQFGHIVAETELDPSGTGMSARPRLKAFRNLPDLAAMFRQVADVKMIDDLPWLKARRPKLKGDTIDVVQVDLTPGQSRLLSELKDRADNLDPRDRRADNMVKITGEGRAGMLDLRLLDRRAPDERGNKMHRVAEEAADIYREHARVKGAQLIFMDAGTPGSEQRSLKARKMTLPSGKTVLRPPTEAERNRGYDLYADLKKKLVKAGIPAAQIAFIHDLDAVPEKKRDGARKALFRKVRSGEVRVLIGSTGKMGTGMNVQERLVALHNVDPAWKPSDIEQRIGRILRQGHALAAADPAFRVRVLNYVAKGAGQQFGFDAYMWQLNEAKAQIIARFFNGRLQERDLSLDLEQTVLTASEMKAIATGNPLVLELAKAQGEVQRLEMVYTGWEESRREAEYSLEARRTQLASMTARDEQRQRTAEAVTEDVEATARTAQIEGETVTGHTAIGEAILAAAQAATRKTDAHPGVWQSYVQPKAIGTYRGLALTIEGNGTTDPWLVLRHPKAKVPRYGGKVQDDVYTPLPLELLTPDPQGPGGQNWRNPMGLLTAVTSAIDDITREDTWSRDQVKEEIARYELILGTPFEQEADLAAAKTKAEEVAKALGVPVTGVEDVQEIDEDEGGVVAGEEATVAERALSALESIEQDAKARLKDRGTLTGKRAIAGLPADDLADLAIIGATKIAKGSIRFAQWSAEMIREFGEAIRPHLRQIYEAALQKAGEARPVSIPTEGRAIPPAVRIPEAKRLEFPSLQKMPEAIRPDVQALLEQYGGFQPQRRDVQSWPRTADLSKDVWLPLETLKPGTALNAEELQAYQTAIATALTARKPLLQKLQEKTATDREKARISYLTDVATVLVASYRGAKAEAGRALNILRVKGRALELGESAFIDKILKAPGFAGDLAKASKVALEAAGDPLKQLRALRQGTLVDYALAIYYANLLSGIKTHLRNLIGNTFNVLANMAVPLGAVPADLYRVATKGGVRAVYLSELPHALGGTVVGLDRGIRQAWFTFAEGFRPSTVERAASGKFDTPRVELPGGLANPFNIPGRALEAVDEFFRTIAHHQELYAGLFSHARQEGLTAPPRIAARMAELLAAVDRTTPDGEAMAGILERASEFADHATFNEDPGFIIRTLLKLKGPTAPAAARIATTIVIPFMRITGAITRQGFEWSPAGVAMRGARSTDARVQAQARGRALLGSMALIPFVWLAATGRLTGAPPDDPGEREEFYALGKLGNAIKIGTFWVRYVLFQPYSVMLSAAANAWQSWEASQQDEAAAQDAVAAAVAGAGQSILDQSFLSGLESLQNALDEPRQAGRWVSLFTQGLVPFSGMLRNITQAVDPYARRPEGVAESVQAITPGQSDTLPVRRTRFGAPVVPRPGPWYQRGFLVPEVSKAASDELTLTLARLKLRPVTPRPQLTRNGVRVDLTREQEDVLSEALGREVRIILEERIASPRFAGRSDETNVAVLERAMADAREGVRGRALRSLARKDAFTVERLLSREAWQRTRRQAAALLGEPAPAVAR